MRGAEGFFYQERNSSGLAAGHRFVGRSATGAGLFRLTQAQRKAALDRFASIMKEFHYTGAGAGSSYAIERHRLASCRNLAASHVLAIQHHTASLSYFV